MTDSDRRIDGVDDDPSVILGPFVRYVSTDQATFWVETSRSCLVTVTTSYGQSADERTWGVHGHHYALIALENLPADSIVDYTVSLDGEQVWPIDGHRSAVHTMRENGSVTVAFGSCRRGETYNDDALARLGADALVGMAQRIVDDTADTWPDLLVFLGDQVYADDPSEEIVERLHARRAAGERTHGTRSDEVAEEICDFEEYTWLYQESWGDERVRRLMATVPTCMILDDHDLRDDWNSSADWRAEITRKPWWEDRVIGAFSSYWVYQHLGNLSPRELAKDTMYAAIRSAGSDREREALLQDFALKADSEPASARWSYHRDIGNMRLVMIDSRCSRDLSPDRRAMVDDAEWAWVREHALNSGKEHVLLGSSLPVLMLPGLHNIEQWNEAVAQGAWGKRFARLGEKLRIELDLEHWAAFGKSFDDMIDLVDDLVAGPSAPKSVVWLSGDVHCSYVAKAQTRVSTSTSLYQLTMSPFRNPLDLPIRAVNRLAIRRPVERVLARLARRAKVEPSQARWSCEAGPWFDNGVMSLTTDSQAPRLVVDHACVVDGQQTLSTTARFDLTPSGLRKR
ncbi:MAG: alkaline phosphatase D family protein [Rhodococcus sp. (in: high G+C Gram-positive bacteria)]